MQASDTRDLDMQASDKGQISVLRVSSVMYDVIQISVSVRVFLGGKGRNFPPENTPPPPSFAHPP